MEISKDYDADLSKLQADLKDKQDEVQKKTFTKWINSYLSRHDPPSVVKDLFADLRDGVLLLDLLKELTGEPLTTEKGERFGNGQRIHHINNVRNALQFLQDKQIKMVNIHAGDIVDGRPSITLGLIWTLILHFQIEESTKIMCSKMFGDDNDKMSGWRKKSEPKVVMLKWAQKTITEKYGVEVKDFGASWRNGVAFNALIHDAKPHTVDMEAVIKCPSRDNLERAFDTAEKVLGIPRLLDPEDVDVEKPDEKSIMTYVSKFVQKFPQNLHSCEGSGTKESVEKLTRKIKELDDWLNANNEFVSRCYSVDSMQMEELLISLNEFSSQLEDEQALCRYMDSEIEDLLDNVPHNFQVMSLKNQIKHMDNQFDRLREEVDSKIKELQSVEILLEKHEIDMESFERWRNYAMEFLNKLEKAINDDKDDTILLDLDKWKDHVSDNYQSIVLINDLETLDKVKKFKPRNYERQKQQILDSLMSFREIRGKAFHKFSKMEFKIEESKCESLMSGIFADLNEIESKIKIGTLSHEEGLKMLDGVGASLVEASELMQALTSICDKNLDGSMHEVVDAHENNCKKLNNKVSILIDKIKSGASLYDDYLLRKSGIVGWVEKMERYVGHLKTIDTDSNEYKEIMEDFKEMMNDIDDQMSNIQESKIILQELAFNSAWSSTIDEETKQFHDLTQRLDNLNTIFLDAMKTSSLVSICNDLKTSIRDKMKRVEESCAYVSVGQNCDDTRAIRVMLEEFEKFESSVSEVEILMEEGYALLDEDDAYRCLANFLKEAFQFCCDSRNVAHERLAILKKSLELWQNYESIRSRFNRYATHPSSSGGALNQESKLNQLEDFEQSIKELEELDIVIMKLSKHISHDKLVELVEDCNAVRENLKKIISSLRGEMKSVDLMARFEQEMDGLQKFIMCRKAGICVDYNDDVDMERIAELMNKTQILLKELTTEGRSKLQCMGELLREIEDMESTPEDVRERFSSNFKSAERSFVELCEEIKDLHERTLSDTEHLMKCGRIIKEVSGWIQSEKIRVVGFRDVADVEVQLKRAEELHSMLEYHVTLMSDLECEANLVSERNINGLVCKLRNELEAFKTNLGECHVKLNDLIDNWKEFIDLRDRIESMKESIVDQLDSCKKSIDHFEAVVANGCLSNTLKEMTTDVEKIIDSNNHLRSIIDKLEAHASEECQQMMWNKLNENEWIYQSLRQEANDQTDNLGRITKEFEIFVSEIDDCLYQIENLYQEIEDVTKDLKEIIACEQTSYRVKDIFLSQLENISLFWNHIKEKKKYFDNGMELSLREKLTRIDSCIRDISDLNDHLIAMCNLYQDYSKLIEKTESNLIELEENSTDSVKTLELQELHDSLEELKKMEEIMKNEAYHLNVFDGKSCDDSMEWLSQSSSLMEKFFILRKVRANLNKAEAMLKTTEAMITVIKSDEYLNANEIDNDYSDFTTIKSMLDAMEENDKERLSEIRKSMKDLDEFITGEENLMKMYDSRHESLMNSFYELKDRFESHWMKAKYLVDKLQTCLDLIKKVDEDSLLETEKSVSLDEVDAKLASLQEYRHNLLNFKESLDALIEDVDNLSEEKRLKMFSKHLLARSSDLSNCKDKLITTETKVLINIDNLNLLKLSYKKFIVEVDDRNEEINSMMSIFKNLLLGASCTVEVDFQKYQENITRLRIEANSMETKPECKTMVELCSEGGDLIARKKNELSCDLVEVQEMLDCLVSSFDQCRERTEIIKCRMSSLKERITTFEASFFRMKESESDCDEKLMKVEEYLKHVEEWYKQIEELERKSSDLEEEFKTFASMFVTVDLTAIREEVHFIKEKLNNLQQTLTTKKEFENILNIFKNFVVQTDGLMESMKTENVRNINKSLQSINAMMVEGEQIEQELIESSSEVFPSSAEHSKIIGEWNIKKQELEILQQFYEEELIKSDSIKMRLFDFKSWMEDMTDLYSEISLKTSLQSSSTLLSKCEDFQLNLKDKEICVENLSNLFNLASNFDENKILIEEGEELILKYSQLRESVKFVINKSLQSQENVEKFQKEEEKVKYLLNSIKQKISKTDADDRFDDKMTKLIDMDIDLDVVQIIIDKMDERIDLEEMSENEKDGFQSCMKSIKIDLLQINESKEKLENNLKEQSDLFAECKREMEGLRAWIQDKECLVSSLDSDVLGTLHENLEDEMSSRMRCIEELKEKIKSLNRDEAMAEISKYSSDLDSLKSNFVDLSSMLKVRMDKEDEYSKGLIALIKCAHEIAEIFEEEENNGHKDHDEVKDSKMIKLKDYSMNIKSILLGTNRPTTVQHNPKHHHLARIHSREELEKLDGYLDNWISFQDVFKKYENELNLKASENCNNACNILGSSMIIQNWHSQAEDNQEFVDSLKVAGENLKPVAMTTACRRSKELWDDVYKAASKLVTRLLRWSSKMEDSKRSWKKFSDFHTKVSEFLDISDGKPIKSKGASLIQCKEKQKNFSDMEGELAGMIEAALEVMTFMDRGSEKVELENRLLNTKEEFERCRMENDMESIKLDSLRSDDVDAVDGNALMEEDELLEQAVTSIIRDTTSPDDGYKTLPCDISLHDIPSFDDSSYKSSEDDAEEIITVEGQGKVNEGLNYFINFIDHLKSSQSRDSDANGILMNSRDGCLSFVHKDAILLRGEDEDDDDSDDDDEDDEMSPLATNSSLIIDLDTASMFSCYSHFLIFLSSCFESFSIQAKPFYHQQSSSSPHEDAKYLDESTRGMEYFNIILPMGIVLKLKKISDWFDPTLQKMLTNENIITRLRNYFRKTIDVTCKDSWNEQNILLSDAILSQKLSRQRNELEVLLEDQSNCNLRIKSLNGSMKELTNSINQVRWYDNDAVSKDHVTILEKSLKKSKLDLEMLRNSLNIFSKREKLFPHLFGLLDAKMEEASLEVDGRKRRMEERMDSERRENEDLEAIQFKMDYHKKWFNEIDKMEFNSENNDIIKCLDNETRSRTRDISKMKTTLELMAENEKQIRECRYHGDVDSKLSCYHLNEARNGVCEKASKESDGDDDDFERLCSDVDRLLADVFQFRKKLRKCKVEKSTKNLIDVNQLDDFNQLEVLWESHNKSTLGRKLDEQMDVTSSSSPPQSSSSPSNQYKDVLERLAVLKLSMSSIDVSKRRVSPLNVKAYLNKFRMIKRELIELLPIMRTLETPQPIIVGQQPEIVIDLYCFWKVLSDKAMSQIELIRTFVEYLNRTNLKIETYKEDLALYQSSLSDMERYPCCTSSHYKQCEELASLVGELKGKVMTSIDDCQKQPAHWSVQNFQTEILAIISWIDKFSFDLNLKKVKVTEEMERWKKFVKNVGLASTRLINLEFMLHSSCEKCQVEDVIRSLRTRFSRELVEISKNLKDLESEGMKLSSDDARCSFVVCKVNLLKSLHEGCCRRLSSRLKKLHEVSEMIMRFDVGLNEFKRWTFTKEKELSSSFKFRRFSLDEIVRTIEILRASQKDLKHHGRDLTCLVGVCEVLYLDSDSCPSPLEREAVMATKTLLDGKWTDVVDLTLGRKSLLEEVWRRWKKYSSDHEVLMNLLQSVKSDLDRHQGFSNFEALSIPEMRRASHFFKELISRMDGECWRRNELKEEYRQLALSLWVDDSDEMHDMLERLWCGWQDTEHSIRLIGRRIGYHLDLFKMFQSSAVSLHQWLVGISTSLEQVEKSFEVDDEFNCRKNFKLIKKMKREVRQKLEEFNGVARSLDVIIDDESKTGGDDDGGGGDDNSCGAFHQGAREVMNNFSKFQSEILQRIKTMERKMNLDILEKMDEDVAKQGSNVDEIERPMPISSHLNKNPEKKSPKSRDVPPNYWMKKVSSVAHTQLLLLLLITSACLLPLSKVQPDDLIGPLSRL